MKYRLYCTLAMMLMLGGCGHESDDIDQFIKDSGNSMKGQVPPLPEVKQFVPYIFDATGDLPDPFKPRKATSSKGSSYGKLQPDLQRPKQALESFPLENLKYVGTLKKGAQSVALMGAPDGQVYQIKIGNYVGQNYGVVTKIASDEVLVKEVVQDLSGDWVERQVTIYPQE